MERVVVSWSGGKESALALQEVRERSELDVAGLLTLFGPGGRSFTHGVRESVMERQAACMDLPLRAVEVPADAGGDAYADLMADVFAEYREAGVERLVLGDVFLEDDDDYRQSAMERTGFRSYCPLLGHGTADLAERSLDSGFEAVVACVDADRLDESFLGRVVDESFLAALPDGVDPCGEAGEYHTFVRDGPGFADPVPVEVGEVVTRPVGEGAYHYADLRLAEP